MNAPELLRSEFMQKRWRGDSLVFSGVTDCYQPIEAHYELTRRCLIVCEEFSNPVAIITKSALIRRDIDLLQAIHKKADLKVFISLAFSDDKMARQVEPYAPSPSVRFRAMEALVKGGISVGIGVAPVIPGLNDRQIPEIIRRSADLGATTAFMTLLRLPMEVKDIFVANIRENFPDRFNKVMNQIRAMRENKLNQSNFGQRMRGTGSQWQAIEFLFRSACERHGMNRKERRSEEEAFESTFKRPERQLRLF